MKITVKTTDGRTLKGALPYEGAEYAVVVGLKCPRPGCESREEPGLRVRGPHPETKHDRMVSPATCAYCGSGVGVITAVFSTVFGIEEDMRVLNGRCRVY